MIELPSPPAPKMDSKEANDVAHQHLAALRRKGLKRVTFQDLKGLTEITGRSRPWVYAWLEGRVKGGDLIKDTSQEQVGYTFSY